MSEERNDEPPKGPPDEQTPAHGTIADLREKVTDAAGEFLKAQLGLENGVDGSLQFPDHGVFQDFGQRADQFVRGFFRGFVDKTPEELEAKAGLRDPRDVPSGTEVATRLLAKVSETMSGAFHEYLKDNAVDPRKPDEQVVVDGRFLLRHGAPLLATFVQALGTKFNDQHGAESQEQRAAEASQEPEAHVDYRVDLPSVFKSLFVRPPSDEGDKS